MGRLAGKKCLVTAAGQGIGRASALAMQAEGGEVIATDINAEALVELAGAGITTRLLDVCDPQAITTARDEIGPVNVLFNCAGFVGHDTVLDCDDDAWAFSVDLNVTAMFRMMRAFLPGMIDGGGGSIINMSSAVSSIIAAPNRFSYGATKAAVIGMTKSVAADFISQGIRCNAICPGTVQSPSLEGRMRAMGDYDTARTAFIARQPMGRLATAEEISELVVYLASDGSGFTTGTTHLIDGGWTAT